MSFLWVCTFEISIEIMVIRVIYINIPSGYMYIYTYIYKLVILIKTDRGKIDLALFSKKKLDLSTCEMGHK